MIFINLELSMFFLDLELGLAIENISVVGQGVTLELEDKLLFLVDVFGLETYFDLFFLFGF